MRISLRLLAAAVAVAVFPSCNALEVSNPARPSVPVQGPHVGGSPSNSTPCAFNSPEAVVSCERGRYDFIPREQMVTFLRDVVWSLNASGIAGGPFGLLKKTVGNNCDGYSCDIVCAGQGDSQRQWDVLLDMEHAQIPWWAGPHGVPDIRVDVCEIE